MLNMDIKWIILVLAYCVCDTSVTARFETSAQSKEIRCGPRLSILWSREVSHIPFAASPVLTDVNADGRVDVVVVSFNGEVHVLNGEAGQASEVPGWPHKVSHSTIHASPIQTDIDGDGMLDLLITTSQGQLIFLDHKGDRIPDKHYQIPDLAVMREWYTKQLSLDQILIHDYILDDIPTDPLVVQQYVTVDPHVLSSPVLADLNQDGVTEELIMAVSYYFDHDHYQSHPDALEEKNLSLSQLDKYLASTLLILNTTGLQVISTLHLELTKVDSEFPGYALFSPTVADLDGDGSELEIMLGTSAGQLHVFGSSGRYREGFPVPTDSLSAQIVAEDVNQDHTLEIIAVDVSGNVMCYSPSGAIVWEGEVPGSAVTGNRVADMDGDQQLEVVVATSDGHVSVLSGKTGKTVDGWPIRVSKTLHAAPLILWLNGQSKPTVVVVGDDSHLHLLAADSACRLTVNLWEKSYAAMASHDLVSQSEGLELVLASQDGTVLCIGQLPISGDSLEVDPSLTWPSETRSYNDFTYLPLQRGIVIHRARKDPFEYTGRHFSLSFTVYGSLPTAKHSYLVQVLLGSHLLETQKFPRAGTYSLTVHSPQVPVSGHLLIKCYNQHRQLFTDSMPVRFHASVMSDLKWLFLSPVLGMGVLLLVLHGFPDVDLLPVSLPGKNR